MKFEFTGEVKVIFGVTLQRIKKASSGDLGGWIEKESNLDASGNAWVSGDAQVSGNAWVYGDAQVSGNAWVSGDAQVYGDAWVYGDAQVAWFSKVGSRIATLTVAQSKEKNTLLVFTGCFSGTLTEFEAAVEKTHGATKYGNEYRALIAYIKIRFEVAT